VIVVLLSPSAWSYGAALSAPGNLPLSVRSVEWLRDHHGRWLVNDIENFWYNHHKPKKGGTPKEALGRLVPTAPGTTTSGSATGTTQGVQHLPPPVAIPPIVANPLPGEGKWQPLGQLVNGVPAMYSAYLRPDPVYTSLVTAVAWMDPTLVKAVLYAGVQEPGGSGWRYQAPVTAADRTGLLAAFNSGFKLTDSRGGYFAQGRTVRPLQTGAATLAIRADGTPTVGQWGRDMQMGPDIAFARQNLALIVDNAQPVPDIDRGGLSKWGATLGNKVLVWRSGVGVTASGALVYAGGNDLSAGSLARVLARAGAVRAMELDINSEWVDFFTYGPAAPGQPPANLAVTKLLPDMRASLNRYFSANSRDFIAIFRR
jgi:Phosphodiester glycosidase